MMTTEQDQAIDALVADAAARQQENLLIDVCRAILQRLGRIGGRRASDGLTDAEKKVLELAIAQDQQGKPITMLDIAEAYDRSVVRTKAVFGSLREKGFIRNGGGRRFPRWQILKYPDGRDYAWGRLPVKNPVAPALPDPAPAGNNPATDSAPDKNFRISAGKINTGGKKTVIRADGLSRDQGLALDALAAYGPGAVLTSTILSADLKWVPAQAGRIYGQLEKLGIVSRERKNNACHIAIVRHPSGAVPPAVKAKPAQKKPGWQPNGRQVKVLALMLKAGDGGITLKDMAAALKRRPGPVQRLINVLLSNGYAEKISKDVVLWRALRDMDGNRIERFPPGTRIEFVGGVRKITYPPGYARDYGSVSITVRSSQRGHYAG